VKINRRSNKIFLNLFAVIIISTIFFIIGCSKTNNEIDNHEKPNVIVIMTDDQGYGELSFHGNPLLKTPNLDALAQESIRFSDFHSSPMCASTRGQLLTGLDAARNGTINVSSGRTLLREELPTMANHFVNNGYTTGIFGKWHLGDNYPYRPEDRGFEESIWFPSSHVSSVPDFWGNDYFDDTYIHNGRREKYNGYCTDIFFDKAIEFIGNSTKMNKPFLAYIPTNAPHWPHFAPDEYIKEIEKVYSASPMAKKEFKGLKEFIGYLAMIQNIDTNIKKLREYLEKENLNKNTILIFLSDNGSTFAPRYFTAGMRGKKTQLWEGGHRVPLFIHYPNGGFTEPREVNGLTHVQDLLPTLIDLCNLEKSEHTKYDGISLLPQLKKNLTAPEDRFLVINFSRMPVGFNYPSEAGPSKMKKDGAAVLWKRWRLLENRELYNLDSDPMQAKNIIDEHPEIVKKMRNHLDTWWEDVKDLANEPQRVVIGNDNENPMMLTSCEWMDVFLDMNYQVIKGLPRNSYWNLYTDKPGNYEFELRRWPRELDIPICETVENGKALPITQARIFIDGVRHHENPKPFSFTGVTKKVSPSDKSVKFRVELEKGPLTLHTWFDDEDLMPICGAYYVYVRRYE